VECPHCGKKVVAVSDLLKLICLGVKLVLQNVERFRCVACGSEYFTPEQATESDRLMRQEYRVQTSLKGADVIRIRRKLGLSQAELEKKLGLGSKVVVRWETGKVRLPGPVNVLLRILDKHPKVISLV
jgi:putative zinc finger/helix-turn-helix YgiT family protein